MQDLKFETSTFQQQVKDEGLRTGVLMGAYDNFKGVSFLVIIASILYLKIIKKLILNSNNS